MVKADLSRDYYGDLQLQPGAEIADIKKQFKKLALAYHPDRNPGRETEVTAQFQLIQSAHEVLTDPTERAKYDNNRARSSRGFGSAYAGSSGVRGNPWSDVASQYPPPPKAPTARRPQQQPSAGAERYKKWEAPKQSAYQAAHEGAGARQKTYEAWESMKTKPQSSGSSSQQPSSGGTSRSNRGPQVPPRAAPQESTSRPPSSSRYDRRPESPPRRSNSTTNFKKGFMPNTPGGDEPAASKGAYFTQQYKSAIPPDLPAREPKPSSSSSSRAPRTQNVPSSDAETHYRSSNIPAGEPRISTPYATQGGEKLNPFDSASINRSRSARESPSRYSSDSYQTRPQSSTNLFGEVPTSQTPHRSQSTRAPPSSRHHATSSVDIDSDSSDEGPELKSFGRSRTRNSVPNPAPIPQPNLQSSNRDNQRKPNKVDQYQQWYKDNPNAELPADAFSPDGSSQRNNQPQANPPIPPKTPADADPTMYANSNSHQRSSVRRSSTWMNPLPTVSESSPSVKRSFSTVKDNFLPSVKQPLFSTPEKSLPTPSGEADTDSPLTDFEVKQRKLICQLLQNRKASSPAVATPSKTSGIPSSQRSQATVGISDLSGEAFTTYREPSRVPSTSRKPRASSILHAQHSFNPDQSQNFWQSLDELKTRADQNRNNRFSFKVNEDTFQSTTPRRPSYRSYSSSAENISTKFSSEEWDGKFAGAEHFQPDPKAPVQPIRTQSGSGNRPRNRSPTKSGADGRYQPRTADGDPIVESPGGTKFSAEEWNNTFKPQTFAAPPPSRQVPTRKRTGTSLRPTLGGNAAVVDDGNSSDEKPLFDGPKTPATPDVPMTPDAMDIDMPPPKTTVPQFVPPTQELSEPPRSPKRPAASPAEDSSLKVNFSDLKIQDLLSTLSLPTAPTPPSPPSNLPGTHPSPAAFEDYALRFAKYMTAWDLYNNQFLLHLVARKNGNDALGQKRWLSDDGLRLYRQGLKEDAAVLEAWQAEKDRHEIVIRDWAVLRDSVKDEDARRTRTKTH